MQMQQADRIREVLELIVCPVCHGRLALDGNGIRCTACGRSYPIEDGTPVLLEARAQKP